MEVDLLLRGGHVLVSVAAGFVGGVLASNRQDERSLRSLEAAQFAAGSLRRVCENIIRSANSTPNWVPSIAAAYTNDRGIDVIRSVLDHVRATDLPATVRIDKLATISLILTQVDNLLAAAAKGNSAGTLPADLQAKIDALNPEIDALTVEMNRLQRPWFVKQLARANPLNWGRKPQI